MFITRVHCVCLPMSKRGEFIQRKRCIFIVLQSFTIHCALEVSNKTKNNIETFFLSSFYYLFCVALVRH